MRAAIVKFSAIAESGRMDASFHLGNVPELDEKIKRAEVRLKQTKARIAFLKKQRAAVKKRVAAAIAAGDVTPIV